MQIPDDRLPELSGEERETVELFQRATPSVVNIANIGESCCHHARHIKGQAAFSCSAATS